jgi:L-lactate dehydrogenase complex protein LldE
VAVLERLGHDVEFPLEQTCCGQMHANSGYGAEALPLVERFARVFGDPSYDAVVAPSGSCVAMVREQYAVLAREAGELRLLAEVERLAPRVFELTEFVADELGVDDVGATFPHRVTYHPACHSLRALGIGDAPLRLLRNVRGLELVELPDAQSCCGFGGTFALKNADTSLAMLADKLRAVGETGAEVVCAADNSCLMHIGGGLSRAHSGVRAMHVAEILAATA